MKAFAASLLLTSIALAANPKDEQTVRNAYAKLAYAVQSRTVYDEAQKNPDLKSTELARKLQDNELRFDITDMSSGLLSDIGSKTYTDFVTKPEGFDVLDVTHSTQIVDEGGQRYKTLFAAPHWQKESPENSSIPSGAWDIPITDAMAQTIGKNYSRYVTAAVTVRFQGKGRTYHTLWLFGSSDYDPLAIDLVTGQVVRDFALEGVYPSALTDTSLRSRSVVNDWLTSTQRVDPSCRTGKQDVCCDSAMRCGVNSEDLRSRVPAPTTKAVPKGGIMKPVMLVSIFLLAVCALAQVQSSFMIARTSASL